MDDDYSDDYYEEFEQDDYYYDYLSYFEEERKMTSREYSQK